MLAVDGVSLLSSIEPNKYTIKHYHSDLNYKEKNGKSFYIAGVMLYTALTHQ
jgi:hypothetical protein